MEYKLKGKLIKLNLWFVEMLCFCVFENCSYVYVLEFIGLFVMYFYEGVWMDWIDDRGKEYLVIYRSDCNVFINVSFEGGGGIWDGVGILIWNINFVINFFSFG